MEFFFFIWYNYKYINKIQKKERVRMSDYHKTANVYH
jgi:hypothetical protein